MLDYGFIDLYPYYLLYIIFLLLNYSAANSLKLSKICFVVLLLFVICRYNVGWDYESYVKIVREGLFAAEHSRYEPISKLFLILTIKMDFYPLLFMSFGLVHLWIMSFMINKLSTDKVMSWSLYLLIPAFFFQDLSTIRQAAATACIFGSYYFLRDRQYIKYLLMVALGIGFHNSAWYGLSMLLIYKLNLSIKVNWILFISSFFLGNLLLEFLPQLNIVKFNAYLDFDKKATTSTLNYFYYLINVLVLLHYTKLVKVNPENRSYINLSNWGIVTFNLLLFEPISSTRLSVFFLIFWVLLLPSFVKLYKSKFLVYGSFLLVNIIFLMIYVRAYNRGILSKVSFIPYEFWWDHLHF